MRPFGWALLFFVWWPLHFLGHLLFPIGVYAQEPASQEEEGAIEMPEERLGDRLREQLGLTGSIRGGFWSSSRMLDDEKNIPTASLWLKGAPTLGANGTLYFEGWVGRLSDEADIDGHLREGYVALSTGPVDLRIGQQIIVWGRADRINPTDNLTPRDFTLLVPDDDDQRLGTLAVKGTYFIDQISMTALWLPRFEPDRIPLRRPPPPLSFSERLPDERYRQGAFKLEQTGKVFDWSLSYFHGYDLFPDIAIDLSQFPSVDLVLEHHPIDVIGADAATTVGRFGLRGEVAYTFTEDRQGDDPEIKNPFLFLVVGGDRTFLESLNVNLQYILHVVSRYHNPEDIPDPLQREVAAQQAVITNQIDRVQQGVSLRISDQWWNQTLEGELVGVLFFPRHDYALRPKVTYAFSDRWKGVIGADLFRGESRSFFGYLRPNSTAYAELRWGF